MRFTGHTQPQKARPRTSPYTTTTSRAPVSADAASKLRELIRLGGAAIEGPWDGEEAITLQKGAEMGLFKLGSTVVCLFPPETIEFVDELEPGSQTRMGQPFAQRKS